MREQLFIPQRLQDEIRKHVVKCSETRLAQLVDESMDEYRSTPLVIKYTSARFVGSYRAGSGHLYISNTPGFTWGDATYVTPLAFPLSSAIFGRVGVVARFDPTKWLVYDATQPLLEELYMRWIALQPRSRQLLLTCHSQLANQFMRNLFRTAFQIDCVLFKPDQRNRWYTRHGDVWMAVSDWDSNHELVHVGASGSFTDARVTVLSEEEFEPVHYDLRRNALIGPLTPRDPNPVAAAKVRKAYAGNTLVHLHA